MFFFTLGGLFVSHGKEGAKWWKNPEVAKTGGAYSLVGGIVETLIGLIISLSNFSNDISRAGVALAASILPIFYGLVFFFVLFFPFQKKNRIG